MDWRRLPLYFVLGVVLGWQIWQHAASPWTGRQTAGLSMVIGGFCFWLTAHIQLGASFSLTPQARTLVTRGLYSKVRNPIYVFGAVLIAGLALYWNRPYFLWAFAILIPLQIWRARKEARVSEEKFGEEYRAYPQANLVLNGALAIAQHGPCEFLTETPASVSVRRCGARRASRANGAKFPDERIPWPTRSSR